MGWLTGLIGGLLEFLLLKEMVASITAGRSGQALLLMALNLCCMIGVLALVFVLWRDQLAACGATMAAALIVCALLGFFARRTKGEGN